MSDLRKTKDNPISDLSPGKHEHMCSDILVELLLKLSQGSNHPKPLPSPQHKLFPTVTHPRRTVQTPQALVAAIRARKLPLSDGRPYCNQLAWLLSGQDVDYTNVMGEEETNR